MASNSKPQTPNRPALGPRRRLPIEQRRTQVLDAALTLMSDHGHTALSVEAIARQARVSKTVVYDAYGGLEPLLRALLDREEAAALASLAHAAPASSNLDDAPAALIGWLRALFGAVSDNPVRAAALLANDPYADLDLAARAILAVGEEGARLLLNNPDQYPPDRLVEFAATLTAKLHSRPIPPRSIT